MKALTVYQPWATLIVYGAKPYEFRGHSTPKSIIGEEIVIHSAARLMVVEEVFDIWNSLHGTPMESAKTALHREKAIEIIAPLVEAMEAEELTDGQLRWVQANFPHGCGVGTARVGSPRDGFEVAAEFGVHFANDSKRDLHANFGWPMLEVERWQEPIRCRGMQGIWNWPTPESVGL